MTMPFSVCILARNGHKQAIKLIDSLKKIEDIEIEICIGNQSSYSQDKAWYEATADQCFTIDDSELWSYGFGVCKQKVIDVATNPWVIVADIGEVWHEDKRTGGIARQVRESLDTPVFSVLRCQPELVNFAKAHNNPRMVINDENARIFDKREMKLLGLIHEEPYHKTTGASWAQYAKRSQPLAFVEHIGSISEDRSYLARKELLYDHLIDKIVKRPELRVGTNFYWWTQYYYEVVKPRMKPLTFKEWQSLPG